MQSKQMAPKNFADTGAGKSLQTIIAFIREHATKIRNKRTMNERPKMPAIFKDNGLWQKREAWVIAQECFRFVATGEAAEQIQMSSLDQQNARVRVESDLRRECLSYMSALAEIFKTLIRKQFLDEYKAMLAGLEMPEEDRSHFITLLLPSLSLDNFERHCWSELPDDEKRLLKFHLQAEANNVAALMTQCLRSFPKEGMHAFVDFAHLPANKKRDVFDKGIGQYFKHLLTKSKKRQTQKQKREKAARDELYDRAVKLWPGIRRKYGRKKRGAKTLALIDLATKLKLLPKNSQKGEIKKILDRLNAAIERRSTPKK